MGSTVVLVFQAPALKKQDDEASLSKFRFCVDKGDKIRMGEALGRWRDLKRLLESFTGDKHRIQFKDKSL
ncbi:phosphatidylserine decarboxylase proenzyme 1, mitochondrial [Tanacetum coccineum]